MHVKYMLATPHLIIVSMFEYFENVANMLMKMLLGSTKKSSTTLTVYQFFLQFFLLFKPL